MKSDIKISTMKSKLISIEDKLIGVIGIDETFAELFEAGKKPAKELESYLLEQLKEHNYIPKTKEQSYARAFLMEYGKFCNRKNRGVEEKAKNLGTWQGVPREEVPGSLLLWKSYVTVASFA